MPLSPSNVEPIRNQVRALGLETLPELDELFSRTTDLILESEGMPDGWGNMIFLRAWDPAERDPALAAALKPLLDQAGWGRVLEKICTRGVWGWFEEAWIQSRPSAQQRWMPLLGWRAPAARLHWVMTQGNPLSQADVLAALWGTLESNVPEDRPEKARLLLAALEGPHLLLPRMRAHYRSQELLEFLDRHWSESVKAQEAVLPAKARAGSRFKKELPLVWSVLRGHDLEQRLPVAASAPKPRF